jgi:general transcription factor IIIA
MDRDLRRHLRAEHNFSDAQVEDAILERDAMSGGQFWIGGLEDPLSLFDSTEPSLPQTPMPYYTNQQMQDMQDMHMKGSEDVFRGMFDSTLGDFETVDPDTAALDAAMGLSDLPPAVNVHEGLITSLQDFLHESQD